MKWKRPEMSIISVFSDSVRAECPLEGGDCCDVAGEHKESLNANDQVVREPEMISVYTTRRAVQSSGRSWISFRTAIGPIEF